MKVVYNILIFFIAISLQSCREELRGEVKKSQDGNTYLVFENTAGCDSVYVNDILWAYKNGEKGKISAGICNIDCGLDGAGLSIEIEEGITFHFDYWGP